MKFDLLIKNGQVFLPNKSGKFDIAVKDGKIAKVSEKIDDEAKDVVDASGKIVVPGAIDVHTHLAMPFGGTISADDYFTGTRAALCGGPTSIIDYPCQRKGNSIKDTLKPRFECVKKTLVVITHSTSLSQISMMVRFLKRWKKLVLLV